MSQAVKIIFMGSTPLALPCLQSLIDDKKFKILAVVTETDKQTGRKKILTPPQVKTLAIKNNINVLQPININKNTIFSDSIKKLQPDFIVTVSYGKILPAEILKIAKYGAINIHPSLLPKYRGASPIKSAIANGDSITGISFIRMNEKLDSGNILYVKKLPIELSDDAIILRAKLGILGGKELPKVLHGLIRGEIKETPQDNTLATYCHKLHGNDGFIDLNKLDATTILNRIRAFKPWPSCFLILEGKRLKIIEADINTEDKIAPGTILQIAKNTISIGTKKGSIIPKTVQLEGKRIMTIQEFLSGNRDLFKALPASPK